MSGIIGSLRRMCSRAPTFASDTEGNMTVIITAFLSCALLFAAFAIDEGALYLEKRRLQSVTDLAAILASQAPDKAEARILQTIEDNALVGSAAAILEEPDEDWMVQDDRNAQFEYQLGRYTPDPTIAVFDRFTANASPPNAVKVTMRKRGTLLFAEGFMQKPLISTSGIAYSSSEAAFSVGSRLASLDGGLLNSLLGGLLGTTVSLDVMDYRALVDARVDLLTFLDAMAGHLRLTGVTYDDVLKSDVTLGQIAKVMASISGPSQLGAATALRKIVAAEPSPTLTVPLGKLLGLGSLGPLRVGSAPGGLSAALDGMKLLTAAAAVANGEHQALVNLGLTVPGLAGVGVRLAIGEPARQTPFLTVGDGGEVVHTAQTRLLVEAKVAGTGALSAAVINLPLYAEVAYADAQLAEVSCPAGKAGDATVSISAKPGVAKLRIGNINSATMTDFKRSPMTGAAKIVDTGIVKVFASAYVDATNSSPGTLRFTSQDIANLTTRSVSTSNLLETAVSSLLADLDLEVQVAGLNLGLPSLVRTALGETLAGVAAPLDAVVYNLLVALGIKIGEADVTVHGVRCQRAVLVQ